MISLVVEILKSVYQDKDYVIHDGKHELNLGAIRAETRYSGYYVDTFFGFFRNRNGDWVYRQCPASTTPTGYWLRNPMKKEGAAILKPGQYLKVYKAGMHNGKYPAFLQRNGKVKVYRDAGKDLELDMREETVQEGFFGINIHRRWNSKDLKYDKSSAGCQVMEQKDLDIFLDMAKYHSKNYGNEFTYTLINERDLYPYMDPLTDGTVFDNGLLSAIPKRKLVI